MCDRRGGAYRRNDGVNCRRCEWRLLGNSGESLVKTEGICRSLVFVAIWNRERERHCDFRGSYIRKSRKWQPSRADQAVLAADTTFQNRVRQSLVAACISISNEGWSGGALHKQREQRASSYPQFAR